MRIIDMEGQLLSDDSTVVGAPVRDALLSKGRMVIHAGTIMAAHIRVGIVQNVVVLFELMDNLHLPDIYDASIVYTLPGSRVTLRLFTSELARKKIYNIKILWRNCRIPTEYEYNRYLEAATV